MLVLYQWVVWKNFGRLQTNHEVEFWITCKDQMLDLPHGSIWHACRVRWCEVTIVQVDQEFLRSQHHWDGSGQPTLLSPHTTIQTQCLVILRHLRSSLCAPSDLFTTSLSYTPCYTSFPSTAASGLKVKHVSYTALHPLITSHGSCTPYWIQRTSRNGL